MYIYIYIYPDPIDYIANSWVIALKGPDWDLPRRILTVPGRSLPRFLDGLRVFPRSTNYHRDPWFWYRCILRVYIYTYIYIYIYR